MKRTPNAITLCLCTTGVLFLYGGILSAVYAICGNDLYLLSGIFLLMLSLINLLLCLFRFDPKKVFPAPQEKPAEADPLPEPIAEEIKTEDPETEQEATPEKKRKFLPFLKKKPKKEKPKKERDAKSLQETLIRIYRPVELLLLADVLLICGVLFGYFLAKPAAATGGEYWHVALMAILFVGAIVLGKVCKFAKPDGTFSEMILRNVRTFAALTKVLTAVIALAVTLELLSIVSLQNYVRIGLAFLFYYVEIMIVLSIAVRATRKELGEKPGIVILLPFLKSDREELSLISFLEENTGITLRSLWSIKYVRKILPFAALGAVLVFWAATGLVYVQSHQQGAVYRFGTLQEEMLSPGLHLTLPYPFDKTELYDTESLNKITIGYKATENNDNVWTEAHGDSEYKLLLGSGNELVSINIRVEYRIDDLYKYLKTATSPVRILEAKAYELVTDRTISADLEEILATNRETFALQMKDRLAEDIGKLDAGVKVVNVILESIHPPVDVAQVYQAFIGAEIDAEEMILKAQASSAVRISDAESSAHKIVNEAYIDYYSKIATAQKEISEFAAAVNASAEYPSEYAYYRYLKAITTAYQGSKLIILGEGVDGSRLYYGSSGLITE